MRSGRELSQGIVDAVNHAGQDDEVLCLVLIGEGGRAFSAGMDLKAMTAADAGGPAITAGPRRRVPGAQRMPQGRDCRHRRLLPRRRPADGQSLRHADRDAQLALRDAGGASALAAVMTEDTPELFVPAGEAAWILLTGGHMTAERAYDVGSSSSWSRIATS